MVGSLGGLAYYDTDADLTWLADANEADIAMTWVDANDWAGNLVVGGVDGWRLPTSDDCAGVTCTGEMSNLFYNVLGGSSGDSITTTHNANYVFFSNVQTYLYWSASEWPTDPAVKAFSFNFDNGGQGISNKGANNFAWAVQSGDVSAVPVPAAVWLFVSGLLGLIGFSKRKKTA